MIVKKLFATVVIASATILASSAALAIHTVQPFGNQVADSVVARTIELDSNTKSVNIEQGETVKFVFGNKSFAWNFNTLSTTPFKMAKIAPLNPSIKDVQIYVSRNPIYN